MNNDITNWYVINNNIVYTVVQLIRTYENYIINLDANAIS